MTDPVRKDYPSYGLYMNSQIAIGRCTYGQENVALKVYGEKSNLKIGSFCSIASDVRIFLGGNHRVDWASTYPFGEMFEKELGGKIEGHPASKGHVTIGHDVWIGHGATILSGITIGDGAVIAANTTVIADIGPYEIFGGNPGKFIRKRFDDEIIDLLLALRWWELPLEEIPKIARDLSQPPSRALLQGLIARYRPDLVIMDEGEAELELA